MSLPDPATLAQWKRDTTQMLAGVTIAEAKAKSPAFNELLVMLCERLLTLIDGIEGTRKQMKCPGCKGSGSQQTMTFSEPKRVVDERCRVCRGAGWIQDLSEEDVHAKSKPGR
jgi:hypothetical protein